MDCKTTNTKAFSKKRTEKNGISRKIADKTSNNNNDSFDGGKCKFEKRKEDTKQNKRLVQKLLKGSAYA
ncbi:hypothetical protein TTHERM_00259640 (macronuclear) [Tetrahymena thermophila SB210]|uniref:Uncharacterized protein n=1 Tax=Tetrahymena thermophila (strain SB210) TaxID=312017 RepID=Q22UC2_TETTS|nr:hypothetical protein TTHERM_00259640 [Tetrahymena thermophila SB210]EAR88765.1 hypothetical protein TTHERM_00259640 [Tetrahymena thermophila SB210]|eukprot:XP_001009010.1 hypothetical protein TTHERM_00259640 [Tetrahymena thermophila SB210]